MTIEERLAALEAEVARLREKDLPDAVGEAFMKFLRQKASETVGPNAPPSRALDYC